MSRHHHDGRLSVEIRAETWPLKAPFRISGHVFDHVSLAVVELRDGELRGRGEAAGVYYFGEDAARMTVALEAVRGEIEAGVRPADVASLLPPGGARNALDCALWELEAQRAGWPVWMLANLGEPRPLVTTFTLSAESPERTAAGALAIPAASALKLKLTGDDPELDAARVRAARRARGDVWLAVDGNQGFTPDRLERLMPTLVEARVALLEQPFPRGCEAWMDTLRSPIPTAADESVQSLAELQTLRGFDMINVKLDKCGGLTEGLAMATLARRMGLGVMVGNMAGTSWSMAPAFLLGQLCDVVDLDGVAVLRDDRLPGISYADGRIACGDEVWGAPARPRPRRPRAFAARWASRPAEGSAA
jgi:L-alanine-DL-glutamate epimerase-like enolase superfamily enzyme